MNNYDKRIETPTISFKPNMWCWLLTITIIAVRAFQPGAEQVSAWSWWSWLLMTFPAFFAVYFFIGCWIAYGCGMILLLGIDLLDWIRRKFRR